MRPRLAASLMALSLPLPPSGSAQALLETMDTYIMMQPHPATERWLLP